MFVTANSLIGVLDEEGIDFQKGLWYLDRMATRERIDEGYHPYVYSLGYFMKRWYYQILMKRYISFVC